MSKTLMTAEQRAREFAIGAFAPFGVKSIEPYVEIIAELIRGAEQDERERIADVIDEAATDSAVGEFADTLEDWKQAAQVEARIREARIRHELQTENDRLRKLLSRAHQYLPAGTLRTDVETERPWRYDHKRTGDF